MSEDQLYELARKRIDRRNRRVLLLGVNIFAFLIYVGAFVAFYHDVSHQLALFGIMLWFGVLVFHVIALGVTQSRDQDIEREIAKLREQVYEKPKRLDLDDADGELIDFPAQAGEARRHDPR
ncbi:MAG TPA: hypothetical protein VHD90_00275 [Phototrophicaceae bacterium]|nr:hypothetical protein [Phototrophicaceae bacterium]